MREEIERLKLIINENKINSFDRCSECRMLVRVNKDELNTQNPSSSDSVDFMTRNNSVLMPNLISFTTKPPSHYLAYTDLIEKVFFKVNYVENFMIFKMNFEFFIRKYLKENNVLFKQYEHRKVTNGSTATYRCKNYRKKDIKCKAKLTFKYILNSDSIKFENNNYSLHIKNCMQ